MILKKKKKIKLKNLKKKVLTSLINKMIRPTQTPVTNKLNPNKFILFKIFKFE